MTLEFQVTGVEEVEKSLKDVAASLSPEQIEPILLEGAKIFAEAARSRAPQGPTGNLKRSLKAFLLDRRDTGPAAMAAVDRKIAPHAHLVEYGTSERFQKKTKKGVGKMPAKPFFRPAYDEKQGQVQDMIEKKVEDLVKEAWE